jgi:hypothetical protein
VLQYSFTWKQLSAIAGISLWNIYFKLVQGAFRAAEIVTFIKALRRHLAPRKLLIVWDRLPAHRSRMVRDYVESQNDAIELEFLPAYAPEVKPGRIPLGALEAPRAGKLLPQGLRRTQCRGTCQAPANTTSLATAASMP